LSVGICLCWLYIISCSATYFGSIDASILVLLRYFMGYGFFVCCDPPGGICSLASSFHVLIGSSIHCHSIPSMAFVRYCSTGQIKTANITDSSAPCRRPDAMSSAVELVLIFMPSRFHPSHVYPRRLPASRDKHRVIGEIFLCWRSFPPLSFLYGIALMFGATGSTSVYTIAHTLRDTRRPWPTSVWR